MRMAYAESPKDSVAYKEAEIAGKCAGAFDFLAVLYQIRGNKAQIPAAKHESNNWLVATKAALSDAGYQQEKITQISSEMLEKESERYNFLMESTPKYLYEGLEEGLNACIDNQALQVHYLKKVEGSQH